MLRKIAFKNYRCFEDSELDIRQIAIIVGNNNAGKSNGKRTSNVATNCLVH